MSEPSPALELAASPVAPIVPGSVRPADGVLRWHLALHGKLVDRPGGTLLGPASEHSFTGCSDSIPRTLLEKCRSGTATLTDSGPGGWARHPMQEVGGVLTGQAIENAGQRWILVARVCGHPESRSHRARFFTQSAFALVSVQDWNPASLAELHWRLRADPASRTDFHLPLLETSLAILDDPLPAGWFDHVRPLLGALLSSRFARVDASPIDRRVLAEFMETLARLLSCLPRRFTWRVPFAAGGLPATADTGVFLVPSAQSGALIGTAGDRRAEVILERIGHAVLQCETLAQVQAEIEAVFTAPARSERSSRAASWGEALDELQRLSVRRPTTAVAPGRPSPRLERFAETLVGGRVPAGLGALDAVEREGLCAIVKREIQDSAPPLAGDFTDEKDLLAAVEILGRKRAPELNARLLGPLLNAVLLDPETRLHWSNLLVAREWQRQPGYRLLLQAGPARDPEPFEAIAAESVTPEGHLHMVLRGDSNISRRIDEATPEDLFVVLGTGARGVSAASTLEEKARSQRAAHLLDSLAIWSLRSLRERGEDQRSIRDKLAVELLQKGWDVTQLLVRPTQSSDSLLELTRRLLGGFEPARFERLLSAAFAD